MTDTDKKHAKEGEDEKGEQRGRAQMAARKGRWELPVFEAPAGALKFWRGRSKYMIHFLLLKINQVSSQHPPRLEYVFLTICNSRSYQEKLSCRSKVPQPPLPTPLS